MSEPLWRPPKERIEAANLTAFMAEVTTRWGVRHDDYAALYRWSIAEKEEFWRSVWAFSDVIAETEGTIVLKNGEAMPGAAWFPDARLNFAENMLRRRDSGPAILYRCEDRRSAALSHAELYDAVSQASQALRQADVGPGDRVAAFLPNIPEAIIAILAASSVGAIWSSCSPDFGVAGVLDRFGQIEPKILFTADGYAYAGRVHDSLQRAGEFLERLPTVERVVVIPHVGDNPDIDGLPNAIIWDDFLAPYRPGEVDFVQLPFNHPLYILYSSGTTGQPKCIVHGAGGTLLQHLKEHRLLCDVKRDERLFYFTTLGWMMWNWLVSGLACEATLLLYDGSPFHPDGNALFDFADESRMSIFGTSAKFLDAVRKAGLAPRKTHVLSALQTMLSTGSPLVPEGFDFVYEKIKPDLCLSSISGGTDIVACFVGGNPIGPVWRGEIQARALGMDVAVFDDSGQAVIGEKGELVCRGPFPSMPLEFWHDPGMAKYRAAYFERFPGVWCHGDWAEITGHDGVVIYGRSDTVLNPGGVRIGTAEIYRQVEQLDEIEESIVVGQDWDDDVRIVLFVKLRQGSAFDESLCERIKKRVRAHATPRHVPARILEVVDIPRTKSGKIVELAVRDVIHGRPVKNVEALANPEALEHYRDRAELSA